jgi:hypothetical protein
MKPKPATNLLDLSGLDPSVEAAIGLGNRRAAEASLSRTERARLTKDRAKEAKRHRFNMDLDPILNDRLAELAEEQRCPASGLANLAIAFMLDALDHDSLDLRPYLGPSKSPRYENTVKLPSVKPAKFSLRGSP